MAALDLARMRLAGQGLVAPHWPTPVATVRALLAVQAPFAEDVMFAFHKDGICQFFCASAAFKRYVRIRSSRSPSRTPETSLVFISVR